MPPDRHCKRRKFLKLQTSTTRWAPTPKRSFAEAVKAQADGKSRASTWQKFPSWSPILDEVSIPLHNVDATFASTATSEDCPAPIILDYLCGMALVVDLATPEFLERSDKNFEEEFKPAVKTRAPWADLDDVRESDVD
ncbi:hypothetical protein DXG01_010195 [Tephrocybe rancida]|nr:hypothetical protein DXG01_010195 [Tephrocybe rancida]